MVDIRLAGNRPFTLFVYLTVAILTGIIAFTAAAGVVDSMPIASVAAAGAIGAMLVWLRRHAGLADALARVPPVYRRVFIVGAVAAVGQLLALTVFIIDPHVATWRAHLWVPMQSQHSCVSSYWVACTVADGADGAASIYDDALYSQPQRDRTAQRRPLTLGPFNVDVYEYPPPFLTLPALVRIVAPDFYSFRRLWFALNLLMVVAGAIAVARRLDTALGTHSVWLTPFVIAAPPIIATLQMGNIQLAVVAAAATAMLLFERRRYAGGGLLLAYVTVSKLFPGVLVFYLLLRRDWRAVGWTSAWSVVLAGAALAAFGAAPYVDFLEHMPKLLSGEAFPAFRNPQAIGVNQSVPGLVFKLKLWGVPHMDFAAMKMVGWLYTAVVVAITAWLALRIRPRGREPFIWLIILILATLRSPFLPTYAGFPTFWLATLVAAACTDRPIIVRTAFVVWGMHAFLFGIGTIDPRVNALWTTVQTVATFVLVGLTCHLLRTPVGIAEVQPDLARAVRA
jgi:alpha-1,2-mannosyltransferase